MGRNRIPISKIPNERNRQSTFTKRKAGLIKKAMELSILCDCEVALIIINGGKKVFPYVSNDMGRTLAKYHELADTGHVLTNADYEIINARNNDPPMPSSRPQRNRAHQAGMYSTYDDDMYYSDDDEMDEDLVDDKRKRSAKRNADDETGSPVAKRKFTLKMGPEPSDGTGQDGASQSASEPVQQYSASGRPLRRSTLRDSSSALAAASQLSSFQNQRPNNSTKHDFGADDQSDSPASVLSAAAFHSSPLSANIPLQQQQQMLQQQQLLQQQQQQDFLNANFAAAAARPGAMPYVAYPPYGLAYPNSGYPTSYLGSAGQSAGSVMGSAASSLFPSPAAPSSLAQSMAASQMSSLASGLNGMANTAFASNGPQDGNNSSSSSVGGSAGSSANHPSNHASASSSGHRKGASGLSVMVPEVKRTSLISPLTPTLGATLAGSLPLLHSPTLTHSAFFPTLPSPSPTTAPSAFGAIFPPFSSDFLTLSSLNNPSANAASFANPLLAAANTAFQLPNSLSTSSMPSSSSTTNNTANNSSQTPPAASSTTPSSNGMNEANTTSQTSSTSVEVKGS